MHSQCLREHTYIIYNKYNKTFKTHPKHVVAISSYLQAWIRDVCADDGIIRNFTMSTTNNIIGHCNRVIDDNSDDVAPGLSSRRFLTMRNISISRLGSGAELTSVVASKVQRRCTRDAPCVTSLAQASLIHRRCPIGKSSLLRCEISDPYRKLR